jgi:TonB family protein
MAPAVQAAQDARPLEGRVFDATGAALPGVTVTLDEGAATRNVKTSADGAYAVADVPAGTHVLQVKVPGFAPVRQEITLARTGDWTRDVTMGVGTVSESITVRTARPAAGAAQAPPAAAAPVRIRVGGNIRPPRKLKDVRPTYPASMRDTGRDGVVRLDAIIGVDGKVAAIRFVGGAVHPDLVAAAIDAVKQWEFSPTLLNGAPVEIAMTVSIAFGFE